MEDTVTHRGREFRLIAPTRSWVDSLSEQTGPECLVFSTDLHNPGRKRFSLSESGMYHGLRNLLAARQVLFRMSEVWERFEMSSQPSHLEADLFGSFRLRRRLLALPSPIDLQVLGDEVLLAVNAGIPCERYPQYFDFLIRFVEAFEGLDGDALLLVDETETAQTSEVQPPATDSAQGTAPARAFHTILLNELFMTALFAAAGGFGLNWVLTAAPWLVHPLAFIVGAWLGGMVALLLMHPDRIGQCVLGAVGSVVGVVPFGCIFGFLIVIFAPVGTYAGEGLVYVTAFLLIGLPFTLGPLAGLVGAFGGRVLAARNQSSPSAPAKGGLALAGPVIGGLCIGFLSTVLTTLWMCFFW